MSIPLFSRKNWVCDPKVAQVEAERVQQASRHDPPTSRTMATIKIMELIAFPWLNGGNVSSQTVHWPGMSRSWGPAKFLVTWQGWSTGHKVCQVGPLALKLPGCWTRRFVASDCTLNLMNIRNESIWTSSDWKLWAKSRLIAPGYLKEQYKSGLNTIPSEKCRPLTEMMVIKPSIILQTNHPNAIISWQCLVVTLSLTIWTTAPLTLLITRCAHLIVFPAGWSSNSTVFGGNVPQRTSESNLTNESAWAGVLLFVIEGIVCNWGLHLKGLAAKTKNHPIL